MAVLDLIWTCIIPDRKNTARFLVEDGLDALLSLLEVSVLSHKLTLQVEHRFVNKIVQI